MMYRRCVGALLAAAVVFGALSAGQVGAFGPRRAAYVPYYGYAEPYGAPYLAPGYEYYYNPYIAPFPAYGILPPGYEAIRMAYGEQRTEARRERPPERPAEDLGADLTRFRFQITVPTENAIVLVGGAKTTQTGLKRVYVTPPLVVDKNYVYAVEVQWTDGAGAKQVEKTSFDFLLGDPTKHLHFPLKMTK